MNTTTTEIKLTRTVAKKVLQIVDSGLVMGKGNPQPGEMCVEAAVCFALGLPHGDNPPCVGEAVRYVKIALNDCPWSTDKARTAGLRALAIAQLGSNEIDQGQFQRLLAFKGITMVQPFYMRKYAEKYSKQLGSIDKKRILSLADQFEAAKTVEAMEKIISDNKGFGFGFGVGFGFGFGVGFGVGFGFGFGVGFGFGFGVGFGVGVFKEFFGDTFLNQTSAIILESLVELKSPGCEWLDLLTPPPTFGRVPR